MYKTAAVKRRKALKRTVRELARDVKACREAAKYLPAARTEAQMV